MADIQRRNSRKKPAKKTRKKAARKKLTTKKAKTSKKARSKKKTSGRPRKGEMPAQLAAHAWPKGTSGNPAGRPKGLTLQERFERLLETTVDGTKTEENPDGLERFDEIALSIYAAFLAGDQTVRREIIRRLWPAPTKVEIGGELHIDDDKAIYLELLAQKFTEFKRSMRPVPVADEVPGE